MLLIGFAVDLEEDRCGSPFASFEGDSGSAVRAAALIVELTRFFGQHNGHPVADRIGKPRCARNELLPNRIVSELGPRHRAYEYLQEASFDFRASGLVRRRALVRLIAQGILR
jgi:hypothetical protein